ncbi:MAG: hypothetical protein RLY31_1076 [Bacteroidota bacterium]|jgi:hypothetical protein
MVDASEAPVRRTADTVFSSCYDIMTIRMNRSGIWLAVWVALAGCTGYAAGSLAGDWQCAKLEENGLELPLDPSGISFRFDRNGLYEFNSTLNYRESGTFSVEGELLYTLDTINKASTEKAVRILSLHQDTLVILMNAEGNERILTLHRRAR